jgi:hypothetical protein
MIDMYNNKCIIPAIEIYKIKKTIIIKISDNYSIMDIYILLLSYIKYPNYNIIDILLSDSERIPSFFSIYPIKYMNYIEFKF